MKEHRIYLYPYKMGSNSCKNLQETLKESGRKVLRINERTPKNHFGLVLNWGNSNTPNWKVDTWINHPDKVKISSNKLLTFNVWKSIENPGFLFPRYTTDIDEAKVYNTIVERHILNGHSGNGIKISDKLSVGKCPLYVEYIKKATEFRVHVFKGEVILVQQKKKRNGQEDVNYQIRNHDNGWVFAVEDIVEPVQLRSSAIAALNAIGLDFGAIDVIYNKERDKCYVLEINTAPGLEGRTLEAYASAINTA